MDGAEGTRVSALQSALSAQGFPVGEIDGEFGPRTCNGVMAFQQARGLPVTGVADLATQRALGLVSPPPVIVDRGRDTSMQPRLQPQDALRIVVEALGRRTAGGAVSGQLTPDAASNAQLLQVLLGALAGRQDLPGQPVVPSTASPSGTVPPVLSPIDKMLGGEALAGKKTLIAVIAYVILQLMTIKTGSGESLVDPNSITHSVFTILIASFGGLGLLAKVDRVVQLLELAASKAPPQLPR